MSGLLQFIADQNSKSDLADWAKQQYGQSNPALSSLAAAYPDSFRQMLPALVNKQIEQNAINQAFPQPSQQPTIIPQQVFPIGDGNNGDQQPGAPVPQTLPTGDFSPLASLTRPQVVPPQQPTALQRMMANYSQLPPNLQGIAAQQQQFGGGDSGGRSMIDDYANAVANYKMPLSGLSRNPALQFAVRDRVLAMNPDYDETIYKERQDTANQMSPGGVMGQKLSQAETAINHLAAYKQASDNLGGVNASFLSPVLNGTYNAFQSQNPDLINAKRFQQMAGDEVAKFTAGSGGSTVQDREGQQNLLSLSQSPAARTTAAQAAVQTMFGKLEPIADQYNKAYGKNITAVDLLSPETKSSLAKLGMLPDNASPQPAQQNGSALSQIAPPSGITPAMAQAELARRAASRGR